MLIIKKLTYICKNKKHSLARALKMFLFILGRTKVVQIYNLNSYCHDRPKKYTNPNGRNKNDRDNQ